MNAYLNDNDKFVLLNFRTLSNNQKMQASQNNWLDEDRWCK